MRRKKGSASGYSGIASTHSSSGAGGGDGNTRVGEKRDLGVRRRHSHPSHCCQNQKGFSKNVEQKFPLNEIAFHSWSQQAASHARCCAIHGKNIQIPQNKIYQEDHFAIFHHEGLGPRRQGYHSNCWKNMSRWAFAAATAGQGTSPRRGLCPTPKGAFHSGGCDSGRWGHA